jgi:uncharacterized membrane protein
MNLTWNASLISHLATLVLFAIIGFMTSWKFHAPRKFWSWALLVAATIVSVYVGPNIELIGVDFSGIYLNTLLVGMGLGMIIGFLVKKQGTPAPSPGIKGV